MAEFDVNEDLMPSITVPEGYVPHVVPWFARRLDMTGHQLPGRLISFDGIDGSGKSSLLARLGDYLTDAGKRYIVVKTPTDDVRNSWVWKAFFHPDHIRDRERVDTYAMTIFVFGDRLIFQRKVVEPALEAGTWVLCDRYILSSAAWHCDYVHQLLTRKLFRPDLSVVVDVEPEEAIRRIGERDYERLHPEDPSRFADARARLLELATLNRYPVIETTGRHVEDSFARLRDEVDRLLVSHAEPAARA